MKQIEAVIFDWAGTTVDYGCMAPVYAFREAFSQYQLDLSLEEIRQPMGMLKRDHIKTILDMKRVTADFQNVHGRGPQDSDLENIYNAFEKSISALLPLHSKVISGTLAVQTFLREKNIKIGTTSGYTKTMMDIVSHHAKVQGYNPDNIVAADEVVRARPYPYMLQRNFDVLGVRDVRQVLKVGDTIVDIQEGLNAGCWSIGVIKGGSMLGLNEAEIAQLSANLLQEKMRAVKYAMLAAGADYVIDSIDELPYLIPVIQQRA